MLRLMGHQSEAIDFALARSGSMLNAGLGTGKTIVGLELIRRDLDGGAGLILCPKVVRSVWLDEARRHYPDIPIAILDGTTKDRIADLNTLDPPFVVILNYESATRMADALRSIRWGIMILDESHRIKGRSSKIARLAWHLARRSRRRLLLTGTPADRPTDWFSQARVMNEEIFGTRLGDFDSRYVIKGNRTIPSMITGYRRLDELADRLAPHVMQVNAEDVLDLPPERDTMIRIDLSPKAMKAYRQLEDDYIVDLGGDQLTAENDLVKLLRLAEMTGGVVDGHRVDDRKESALKDWLADTDEPIVVVCRFRSDLDAVHRAADGDSGELSGRRDDLQSWKAGRSRILAMQIQAGGVGISLVRARTMVFYSVGYSLIDMNQARGRIRRPGQDRPVNYLHLIARNTVDEMIARAHVRKLNVIETIRSVMRRRAAC